MSAREDSGSDEDTLQGGSLPIRAFLGLGSNIQPRRNVIRANGTVPYLEGLNLMKQKLQESRRAKLDSGLR